MPEVLDGVRCVLLCMLEAVESVLHVLELLEVIRYMLCAGDQTLCPASAGGCTLVGAGGDALCAISAGGCALCCPAC